MTDFDTENANLIQLKKDYDNAYNIYLTKKKEYDDADTDYRLYLQNGRDWTFQEGNNGYWTNASCNNACNSNQSAFPEGGASYDNSLKGSSNLWNRTESCWCSFPNSEVVKNKFNIKNQKKIESDTALAESTSKKNIYDNKLLYIMTNFSTQNTNLIQLKKNYDNAYNIYLTKKKEYDDTDADYRLYLQNGRDWTLQKGGNGNWRYDTCNNACNSNQSAFPEGGAGYSISIEGSGYWGQSCLCSFPNVEIVKNKFNIKNQKKIESEAALAESTTKKNIYDKNLLYITTDFNTQKTNKIQLKDYDNAYNIYLTKKKEYDDADADYRLYLQNGRDWTLQKGGNGNWRYDACNNACNSNQSAFPEGNAGYSISIEGSGYWGQSCLCSFPNVEIVKNKFNIKNQKKIESDAALAESISIKNKLV